MRLLAVTNPLLPPPQGYATAINQTSGLFDSTTRGGRRGVGGGEENGVHSILFLEINYNLFVNKLQSIHPKDLIDQKRGNGREEDGDGVEYR